MEKFVDSACADVKPLLHEIFKTNVNVTLQESNYLNTACQHELL